MKKFKFSFKGRQARAIGIFYGITDTYTAENMGQALYMLYTDYECISGLKCNGKIVFSDEVTFEECEVPKRKRDEKGIYIKS